MNVQSLHRPRSNCRCCAERRRPLVQRRDHLPAARQGLRRQQRRRHRRFRRADRQAGLPAGSRCHGAVADAVLSVTGPRRRLRHRRLRRDQSRLRHHEGFPPLHQPRRNGVDCASSPSSSSITPRTSIRGFAARGAASRIPARATGTSGATPTRSIRARGSSFPTSRNRTGPGIRRRRPITGTASSRTSRT